MAGTIIGRISVRVMPDTSDFRAKAKRDLQKIEDQLGDLLVSVRLDTAGLAQQASRAQKTMESKLRDITVSVNLDNEGSLRAAIARVQRELDALDDVEIGVKLDRDELAAAKELLTGQLNKVAEIKLHVDPNSMNSLENAIDDIDREMEKLREIEFKVKPNMADLKAARELMEEQLQKQINIKVAADNKAYEKIREDIETVLGGIRITPDMDTTKIRAQTRRIEEMVERINDLRAEITPEMNEREKRRVEREIEKLQDKIDDLKAQIQIDINTPSKLVAQASLAVLTRDRFVHIIPTVSKSAATAVATTLAAFSGARLASDLLDKLWDSVKNLDKAAPIIGGMALAIANLGSVGIAAASELASLAVSLAQIAPAALTLPGILGGIVLGVGATVIAFKDFNNRIPEVKTALSSLKTAMQDKFWNAAEAPIRKLVDSLLPEFSAGMTKVSGQLGEFFGALATGLGDSLKGELTGMFDDLSTSIDIASGATGDLANIIKILGETGAGYLPRLAQWFVDVTKNVSDFLTTASQGGANSPLNKWINQAIEQLKALGRVVVSVASILYGLGTAAAAAGGSTLSTLADGLSHIADVVNSPAFQTGLTSVFVSAYAAMNQIATVAGPAVEKFFGTLPGLLNAILPVAGAALGALVKGLSELMANPAFQGGLVSLFEGIGKAVTALAPAFAPVGAALGAIGSLLGTFMTTVGPVLAQVFIVLADVIAQLAPALEPVVQILGGALLAAVQAVTPLLANLGAVVSGLVSSGAFSGFVSAAAGILPALAPLAPLVGDLLVSAFRTIASVLGPVATLFATLVPIIANLAATVLPVVGPLLEALGATIGTIVTALTPFIAKILEIASAIVGPLIAAIAPVITEHLPQLGAAFQNLVTALMPVLNMLQTVVDFIMPYLVPALTAIANTIMDNVVVAFNFIVDVIKAAVKIIQGLWDIIAGIFTGDWSRVWTGVKEVFGGVWDAIVAIFKAVVQIVINTFTNLASSASGSWSSLWNGIKGVASSVWNWLTSTWSSITGSIASIGNAAWNTVRGAFTSLGSALKSTATSMWNSIKNAFTTGTQNAIAVVRGLPGLARSALGNLGSVLVSAGKQLLQGLIDGIKSMFGQLQSTLGGLTSMLPDWKGPPSRDATLLTDAGRLIMDGFINGLESRYDAVRKSLSGLTDEIGAMTVATPGVSAGLTASVTGALADQTSGGTTQKILNYYAAPGSSIDSEEDLFAASGRARMVGW